VDRSAPQRRAQLPPADPGRKARRPGQAWTLGTVRAILANPRYTGRQVWNRQPSAIVVVRAECGGAAALRSTGGASGSGSVRPMRPRKEMAAHG